MPATRLEAEPDTATPVVETPPATTQPEAPTVIAVTEAPAAPVRGKARPDAVALPGASIQRFD